MLNVLYFFAMPWFVVAEGTKTLCKGICDELEDVDVGPNGTGHHCTPQENGALKGEISQLDTLMLSSFSNYEVQACLFWFIWTGNLYSKSNSLSMGAIVVGVNSAGSKTLK